jgi:hypothetical protein
MSDIQVTVVLGHLLSNAAVGVLLQGFGSSWGSSTGFGGYGSWGSTAGSSSSSAGSRPRPKQPEEEFYGLVSVVVWRSSSRG